MLRVPRDRFPESFADFTRYVDRMLTDGTLRAGRHGVELSKLVLRPSLLRLPGKLFIPWELITTGLLPRQLRGQYGLAWGARQERLYRLFVIAVPRLVAVTPPVLRVWPLPGHNVKLAADFSLSA
jgi:uncharacterized protein (DUF2236 family)